MFLQVVEVLLRIQTVKFNPEGLNATSDYSYIDAPTTEDFGNTSIVPRQAIPNSKIPAMINGQVIWGGIPVAVSHIQMLAASQAFQWHSPGPISYYIYLLSYYCLRNLVPLSNAG